MQLTEIAQRTDLNALAKLNLFFDSIFASTYLAERKMCLGGMLASDVLTLPANIQQEVKLFFTHLTTWLTLVLQQGVAEKIVVLSTELSSEVALLLATLEGALLLARLYQEEVRFLAVKKLILTRLQQQKE